MALGNNPGAHFPVSYRILNMTLDGCKKMHLEFFQKRKNNRLVRGTGDSSAN
jgi:hypothetical protein